MKDLRAVFLNGTVGVGKSTLGEAFAELLRGRGIPHVVIDLDYIRRAWPAPAEDRFQHELELRNLHALAANYRDVGVWFFVLVGVIEGAAEIPRYEEALGASMTVVNLTASSESIEARLRARHRDEPDALTWHLSHAPELSAVIDSLGVGSDRIFTLNTTKLTPEAAASKRERTLF